MIDDAVSKDVVRLRAGPVLSCAEFRDSVRAVVDASEAAGDTPPDKKQAVADAIMVELEKLHVEGEEERKRFLHN